MRGHVFNFFRRGKFTKQNPVPQDVQHSLIDLLKLGFVHTGERYGFRPTPAAAIRIKMLGIKPGLNGYPFPEGIERFKKGDVPGSQGSYVMEVLFRRLIKGRGIFLACGVAKKINEPGDKFLFPRCDRAALWRPVVETKLKEFKKSFMKGVVRTRLKSACIHSPIFTERRKSPLSGVAGSRSPDEVCLTSCKCAIVLSGGAVDWEFSPQTSITKDDYS